MIDLADSAWENAVAGAHDAIVSFPLLIGADGASRTDHVDPDLVASRTFVAQDGTGRIVIGTAISGFFSLDLVTALDLDGGPFACQAVRLGPTDRRFCGQVEITPTGIESEPGRPDTDNSDPGLPLVLLAFPVAN